MIERKSDKIFVSVRTPSEGLLRFAHFVMFAITPVAVMLIVLKILSIEDFQLTLGVILIAMAAALVLALVTVNFYIFRHYTPYKIITDDSGLTYSGLLRTVRTSWNEIISIKMNEGLFTAKSFQVKTQTDNLNIPIHMKEKDSPYPKLSILNNCWITADHSELELSMANCPLYIEIQKHIQPHLITGSTADRD